MAALSMPTREQALYWSREVGLAEALGAASLSGAHGQTPRDLTSVPMVEAFLSPLAEDAVHDLHTVVHWVSTTGLTQWVRETVGDLELADAVGVIADDGRAFGFQVRDLKPLLAERVGQYAQAISASEPEA